MKYNYTYTEWSHDTRTIEVTCQRPLTSDEVLELSCEVDYKDGSTAKNILEDGKNIKSLILELTMEIVTMKLKEMNY